MLCCLNLGFCLSIEVESFTLFTLMEEERRDVMTPNWTFTSLNNGADKLDLLFTIEWRPVDCLVFSFVKKVSIGKARLHVYICVSLSQGF